MSSCYNTAYYGESERHFFVKYSENFDMTPLTRKQVKNSRKLAIIEHILLNDHDSTLRFSKSKPLNLNYTSKNPFW